MAQRELSILVRAKGAVQAARDIGKVDSSIGRLSGHAQRGVQNAVTNIARIGVVAAGVVASQVIVGAKSLARIETINAQTAAAIKSTGGAANVTRSQIDTLASSLESLTATEAEAITEGANLLLTFTNIRNEAGRGNAVFNMSVAAITDMSRALGQDTTQSAMQLGKALNDPIKGVTALRRVGIQFTESQVGMIKSLVNEGNILEAQKIILGEINREFGGSGSAFGNTAAGKIAKLGHTWGAVQETLAIGVLPAVQRVAEWLNEKLLEPGTQAGIAAFAEDLRKGADAFVGWLETVDIGKVASMLGTVKDTAAAVVGIFTSMPSWVQEAVITGWGLNKLTGGAFGSIVGELGKGLIRGVLGMNAGVVHIKAATVIGAPGGPGMMGDVTKGGAGMLGVLGIAGLAGLVAAVVPIAVLELTKHVPKTPEQQKILDRREAGIMDPVVFGRGAGPGGKGPRNPVIKLDEQRLDELQQITDMSRQTKGAIERARINTVAVTRTGDASIVAAIRALRLDVTIPVNISGIAGRQTIRVVRTTSGTTLSRYSGKLVPI